MQKLAEICVRRPVFATMLILSLTVVGLFSFRSLGVDLFPKIDLPTITVTVVNPGASPQEIETEVTDIADKQIKRLIEPISGVGNVEIVGGRQREIEIWVDPDKMRAFNVSAADVANAVKSQNMELPGGRVEQGQREFTVRTMGRIPDPAQFNNLVVANRGAYSVKLSDIGYVEDGAEEQRTEARLNSQPAVTLVVSKQSGQNTVAVADAGEERFRSEEDTSELPSPCYIVC